MPEGVGYRPGELGALAAQARAAQAQIPQPGAVPEASLEQLLSALQGNPQMMLQLLALLAGAGGGQMAMGGMGGMGVEGGEGGEIASAMMDASGAGY